MTTSSYTPAATTAAADQRPAHGRGVRSWRATLDVHLRSVGRARVVEIALDLIGAAVIAAAFAEPRLPADLMFHIAFVFLVLHAFFFGLRGTLVRIALVSVPLTIYAFSDSFGIDLPEMELAEWPLMFLIAILVAWMADRRASTARRYAALFRRASERLLTVEEAERRHVAGEMHDGVGQVLTALTLTLDAAAGETELDVVRRRLKKARRLAGTALAETRALAHRMRPARFEERGLVAAIRDLAAQSGFAVRVEADAAATEATRRLAPTTMVEIYRMVQESLANAARHSGADAARVTLTTDEGRLDVQISDAGVGFDVAVPADGIGLAGMAERAQFVAGHLTVRSAPGHGTSVRISVPLPAVRAAS